MWYVLHYGWCLLLKGRHRLTGLGVAMAAYSQRLSPVDFLTQILLWLLGMSGLHSAFCVFNDICDIEFDKRVGQSHRCSRSLTVTDVNETAREDEDTTPCHRCSHCLIRMGVIRRAARSYNWSPLLHQRYCVRHILIRPFCVSSLRYSFWLGVISIPLHMMYPLAKRWLFWPQLMLGKP